MGLIPTGSPSIDKVLGGGIRTGLITNILSDSREARFSLCYSLCVNAARLNNTSTVIFGDTQGIFRPEKILSYLRNDQESKSILQQIRRLRILSTNVQMILVNYALQLHPVLIIIDNFNYLFLNEKKRKLSVQFSLRKHLHDLALCAINNDVAVVITNAISSKKENKEIEDIFEKKVISFNEQLNKTISNFTHVVLELKTVKADESRFTARSLKPRTPSTAFFMVKSDGLYDF